MRKHARNRVRTRGKRVLTAETRMVALFGFFQSSPKWREWTFRTVSLKKAETMAKQGEVVPVLRWHDGAVRAVGYIATKPVRLDRPSPTTLTFATMRAVGNQDAGADLTANERREIDKFRVWPLIGDTKAVAVRPRMTDDERKFAMKLLNLAVEGSLGVSPRAA